MRKFSVLFVDDDINVLSSLKRGLIDEEYKAFFATSGDKALSIMEETEISVIVTDMRMPGMDGLKLLKLIKEKYPNTVKIVLSGYTQLPQILATVNQVDIFKFITKPWNLEEELIPIIRQAVEYYVYMQEKEKQRDILEKRNNVYQNILRATDEKFLQNKNDFENVKEISKYIFNTLEAQAASQDRSKMLDIVQYIEGLYLEYLKVMPTSIVDFRPEKLETDVYKWLVEQKLDNRVNIKKECFETISLRENYILIFFIVTNLIKELLPFSAEKSLEFIIDVKDGTMRLLITTSKIEKHFQTAFMSKITTEILISFLNTLCKTIDSIVLIQNINESLSAELNVPAKA